MSITRLAQLFDAVSGKARKRLVAAAANDIHTLEAIRDALDRHLIDATLVGDEAQIRAHCASLDLNLSLDPTRFEIIHEPDDALAAAKAVALVRKGHGHFLMKGSLQTAVLMHAILDHQTGILEPGALLSHVSVIDCPSYGKLLVMSDAAVVPHPDQAQKLAITRYVIGTAHLLGIEKPRIAILGITERVNPKMPSMVEAAAIAQRWTQGIEEGPFAMAYVDGPLPLDAALDSESAAIKGVKSEVGGQADGLVCPDIESGNIFYKACTKLAGAEAAGMLVGARVPCVVSSRGDSALAKLYSIALAALASQ